MKTTAKTFIIIGIIFNFWLIFPMIVGFIALSKIDEAENVEELKTMGILTLLFCNLLGGIFMLNIKNEELENYNLNKKIKKVYLCKKCGYQIFPEQKRCPNCGVSIVRKSTSNKTEIKQILNTIEKKETESPNIQNELLNAKTMFEKKIINEEEYQKIRTSIINKYYQ